MNANLLTPKDRPVHTPGPWRFIVKSQTVVSSQSHPICTLSDPFHRQCHGGRTGVDGPLIASGPALRAGLVKAIEQLEGWVAWKCPSKHRPEHLAFIDTLKQIVAQADGSTP